MEGASLFISQRINRFPIHSNQGRDDDAQGHNHQHQHVLNDTYNKEVQPEGAHPIRLLSGPGHCLAFGESEVNSELQPDDLPYDAGYEGKQSNLRPHHPEDAPTLGTKAS